MKTATDRFEESELKSERRAISRKFFCGFALIALIAGCGVQESERLRLPIDADGPGSFASRQIRYMTPFDLIQLLRVTFPVPDLTQVDGDCTKLTDENRGLIGDNSPLTGTPIFDEPSSGFVRWYAGCLNSYLEQYASQTSNDPKIFYGETLGAMINSATVPSSVFLDLPADLQKRIVLEIVEKMVGPDEVIADFGYFTGADALADHVLQSLDAKMSVKEAVTRIYFLVGIRDEFLSY